MNTPKPMPASMGSAPAATPLLAAPRKVLVVDDEPVNRKLLRAQLEYAGYAVIACADGVEALAALEREPVDVVITDISMPTMDGYRFCSRLRQHERLAGLPLVFLSGSLTPDAEKLALDLGGEQFLHKPAGASEIVAAVERAVALSRRKGVEARSGAAALELAKLYSDRLIGKLEEKNAELRRAEQDLRQLTAELERRVAERTAQLEAANKDLEGFSYSVSHDLRAPLRAIDNFSAFLLEDHAGQLDVEGQRLLGVIRNNTVRMSQLINDVLEFSRAGKSGCAPGRIDMEALAHEVFDELHAPPQRPVTFTASGLPPAWGDQAMLRQVVTNLLTNALKFTAGRADAVIEMNGRMDGPENLYWVRDNGAGFDPQYAHKLFGVFQRLHGASEFEGTGIGLAIVKRIVSRHGGRVWAECNPGGGATFGFSLPLWQPNQVTGATA